MKRSKIQMMGEFMAGLNCMRDASRQMIHQMPDNGMKWMGMCDMLDKVYEAIKILNPGMSKNG